MWRSTKHGTAMPPGPAGRTPTSATAPPAIATSPSTSSPPTSADPTPSRMSATPQVSRNAEVRGPSYDAGDVAKRTSRGWAGRGLGRPCLERLQRGPPVLDRLPGPRAARRRTRRPRPGRPDPPGPRRSARSLLSARLLPIPAPRPAPPLAGARPLRPAAGALARARAPARRPRGVARLHGRRVGQRLLPPAHRRPVAQRAALLAPRAHRLRPHERERPRAGPEDADEPQRRHAPGRGAWRGVDRRHRGGRSIGRRP